MRLSVRGVLFDLDGVLVDSTAVVERHWRTFCEENNLPVSEVLPFVHGRRTIDNMRSLAPNLDFAAATAAFEKLEMDDIEGLRVLPGASEILDRLPTRAWAVVTSGSRPVASARLKAAQLPMPSVLVTADDVLRGKPDPEGYLLSAKHLGQAPADCLVVEDTAAGLVAGKVAGARTLALLTTQRSDELGDPDFIVPDLRSCRVISGPQNGAVLLELTQDSGRP